MSARYLIEKWFQRIKEGNVRMEREDVCFLMVQARHLIEANPAPEKYRVVSFYADWTVHTALDRSPVCFEMLRDITGVLAENWGPTKADITLEVSKVIGFGKLRAELTALFRENGFPLVIFEFFENWQGFVGALIWLLQGKPIGFPANPKGQAKKIREEMLAMVKPANFAVESLVILDHEGKAHWCLQLSGDKVVTLMGIASLGESRDVFSPSPSS